MRITADTPGEISAQTLANAEPHLAQLPAEQRELVRHALEHQLSTLLARQGVQLSEGALLWLGERMQTRADRDPQDHLVQIVADALNKPRPGIAQSYRAFAEVLTEQQQARHATKAPSAVEPPSLYFQPRPFLPRPYEGKATLTVKHGVIALPRTLTPVSHPAARPVPLPPVVEPVLQPPVAEEAPAAESLTITQAASGTESVAPPVPSEEAPTAEEQPDAPESDADAALEDENPSAPVLAEQVSTPDSVVTEVVPPKRVRQPKLKPTAEQQNIRTRAQEIWDDLDDIARRNDIEDGVRGLFHANDVGSILMRRGPRVLPKVIQEARDRIPYKIPRDLISELEELAGQYRQIEAARAV